MTEKSKVQDKKRWGEGREEASVLMDSEWEASTVIAAQKKQKEKVEECLGWNEWKQQHYSGLRIDIFIHMTSMQLAEKAQWYKQTLRMFSSWIIY